MTETKVCECGKEFEVINFSWQCADCKKSSMERQIAERKAMREAEKNSVEKCNKCGTTERLTVHFGMNEQTGKYSFHFCEDCSKKQETEKIIELENRNRKQEIYNAIAKSDN
jgi:hypothetical protein